MLAKCKHHVRVRRHVKVPSPVQPENYQVLAQCESILLILQTTTKYLFKPNVGKEISVRLIKLRSVKWELLALLLIANMFAAQIRADAQNVLPPPASVPAEKVATISLDSVNQLELAAHVNETVKVEGTIGSYIENKTRYRFSMDDSSVVEVIGEFPQMGGTRWTLTARVVPNGSYYELSEVSKEPIGSVSKITQPILIGSLIVLLGLLIFAGVLLKTRAENHKDLQRQLENEQNKAATVPSDIESSSHELGTVTDIEPAAASARSHTIISVGAVEIVSGPHANQKFALIVGETRVGRQRDQEIPLPDDAEVSSHHGSVIVTSDGEMYYRDQSTNGSVVDGHFIHHDQRPLQSGSEVELGASALRFAMRNGRKHTDPEPDSRRIMGDHEAHSDPSVALSGPRSAPTMVVEAPIPSSALTVVSKSVALEVINGPDFGKRFPLTQATVSVGRENCDIILVDESVSRRHATLTMRGGMYLLTDENSTHGTFVNGGAVGKQGYELRVGDRVTLGTGATEMMYAPAGE